MSFNYWPFASAQQGPPGPPGVAGATGATGPAGPVSNSVTLTVNQPVVGNNGAALKLGTKTGNNNNFATATGTLTPGQYAIWDADGNLIGGALPAQPCSFGITISGGGSVITAGQKGYYQLPYAMTITGWSILADQAGSITVEVDAAASAAPPAAPTIPNTTTDKISAAAPVTLTGAQAAAVAAAGVASWGTARAQWDVIGFNVTGVPATVTQVTILVTGVR